MEETRITATELARNLSDILNRVRYKGERFRIERNGETVAVLEPGEERKRFTVADFIALIERLPPVDEDFWKDIEEARKAIGPMPEPSWDS